MLKIYTFPQGSEEWFQCRLGVISASHCSDVLAKGKGKTRRNYMLKLAAEILTGTRRHGYESEDMRRGVEQEPEARRTYEFIKGVRVSQIGFATANGFGYSPDGLIGPYGTTEIKCVLPETQIETILADKMPTAHIPQVQMGMMMMGCAWCDFISYSPLMQKHIFIKRIVRDEEYIHNLKPELRKFKEELMDLVGKLK